LVTCENFVAGSKKLEDYLQETGGKGRGELDQYVISRKKKKKGRGKEQKY